MHANVPRRPPAGGLTDVFPFTGGAIGEPGPEASKGSLCCQQRPTTACSARQLDPSAFQRHRERRQRNGRLGAAFDTQQRLIGVIPGRVAVAQQVPDLGQSNLGIDSSVGETCK